MLVSFEQPALEFFFFFNSQAWINFGNSGTAWSYLSQHQAAAALRRQASHTIAEMRELFLRADLVKRIVAWHSHGVVLQFPYRAAIARPFPFDSGFLA